MLSGPPLPLPPDISLHRLLAYARQPGTLGAWVRGSVRALHLFEAAGGVTYRLLISPDLGHLLGRCARIALREETRAVVLEAGAIIQWRALQVVTAIPYLPGVERLRAFFPGLQPNGIGFVVPLPACSPEQVMAELLACGVPILESRLVYPHLEPLI